MEVPDKDLVQKIVDKNINGFKEKIIQQLDSPEIAIVPCIRKIDLYMVPEYIVEYEYNGQKNEIISFAYETQTVNQSSYKNLTKKIKKLSIIFNSIFYSLCGVSVLFALIHMLFIRIFALVFVDLALAGLCVVTFFVTKSLSKKLIIKTKKQHFEEKKQTMLDYISKNNLELTNKDYEIINNYLRWY